MLRKDHHHHYYMIMLDVKNGFITDKKFEFDSFEELFEAYKENIYYPDFDGFENGHNGDMVYYLSWDERKIIFDFWKQHKDLL
jgi:hypothetical protein